jgi:hypothetical protein
VLCAVLVRRVVSHVDERLELSLRLDERRQRKWKGAQIRPPNQVHDRDVFPTHGYDVVVLLRLGDDVPGSLPRTRQQLMGTRDFYA